MGSPASSSLLLNSTSMDSSFYGFSSLELCNVPAHIWEVSPKKFSLSIQVHDKAAFDVFEGEVKSMYGEPENKLVNGNIYRGAVYTSNGCPACVTITFYSTTWMVRVQGAGYGLWANNILPLIGKKIWPASTPCSSSLSSPVKTKTVTFDISPVNAIPTPGNNTSSTPVNNYSDSSPKQDQDIPVFDLSASFLNSQSSNTDPPHDDYIKRMMEFAEQKGQIETENRMLRDSMSKLEGENTKMRELLNDKQVELEFIMAKASEVDLLEFQNECNVKLLESERAKFSEERENLLRQIQELSSNAPAQPTMSYSEAVASNSQKLEPKWETPKSKRTLRFVENTSADAMLSTNNRFEPLSDSTSNVEFLPSVASDSVDSRHPNPTIPHVNSVKQKRKPSSLSTVKKHCPSSSPPSTPSVVILGDSIANRIDGKRLSRNANITNLSVGGRRIDQVCQDVESNKSVISNANSVIVHIGTNNLRHDSVDRIKDKMYRLKGSLEMCTSSQCEIALSSIILRRDVYDSKVQEVNMIITQICQETGWTFIDNKAITRDLLVDNVHPGPRGMSFLARNMQDFLRCVFPHLFRRTIYPEWLRNLMT